MPVRKGRGSQSARVDMPADADSSVLPDLASMGEQCDWLRERLGLHPATVIELVLLDTEQMTRIHVAYLAEPGPTDVMAFPMDPPVAAGACLPPDAPPPLLGEIVLCPDFIAATDEPEPLAVRCALRITHAMLHLIGHDHADDVGRERMFAEQERLMHDWLQR